MSYNIVPTQNFIKNLKRLSKKHRSIKEEVNALGKLLKSNPTMREEIIEHCFKICISITSKNKGKIGGARIITHVYVSNETVFLLSIYDKGEQQDISTNEIKTLLRAIELDD